jgi:DNA-binding winged helix-turn-helix (wHTH) protein/tetratricopeptide (TPR) repeat protein/TolB-like protein
MIVRFADFEFDRDRAELRRSDGKAIKLRTKTFDMLALFAANPGIVLSKQELMDGVWPNVHVGEDNLFQCIRELRVALGDDKRCMVKLVSGRGYLFDVDVATVSAAEPAPAAPEEAAEPASPGAVTAATAPRHSFAWGGRAALAGAAGVIAIAGLAVAAPIVGSGLFKRAPTTIAVMPIVFAEGDNQMAAMARGITGQLTDGLAGIDNIRVVAPQEDNAAALPVSARAVTADFTINSELERSEQSWTLRTRMVRTADREVQSTASVSVDGGVSDPLLQQARLAAGAGHVLARRVNALLHGGEPTTAAGAGAKAAIEQATASIIHTSRERFAVAQTMLEKALADDPDNVDLAVALSGLQLRGIQMVWYSREDAATAESNARTILERALRNNPEYIPALQADCRFLSATNRFVEALVTCARALKFDPWNGAVLYNLGLSQLYLGRFDDALATFQQADRFDTPEVSRWTWLLGIGWVNLMMGRYDEALPWLQRSIAITPASGRPYLLVSAAQQMSGRPEEAKASIRKALELRPGSTAVNTPPPFKNASPIFIEGVERILQANIEAGLPPR